MFITSIKASFDENTTFLQVNSFVDAGTIVPFPFTGTVSAPVVFLFSPVPFSTNPLDLSVDEFGFEDYCPNYYGEDARAYKTYSYSPGIS